MGALDTFISLGIIAAFAFFIWSKIYAHEKDTIDPLIKKIKGWFVKEEGGEEMFDPNEDFELAFRGQQ